MPRVKGCSFVCPENKSNFAKGKHFTLSIFDTYLMVNDNVSLLIAKHPFGNLPRESDT